VLDGVEGYTHEFQVRWTEVGEALVPQFVRRGYVKLDITKRR
jgi:hypothetical protein